MKMAPRIYALPRQIIQSSRCLAIGSHGIPEVCGPVTDSSDVDTEEIILRSL